MPLRHSKRASTLQSRWCSALVLAACFVGCTAQGEILGAPWTADGAVVPIDAPAVPKDTAGPPSDTAVSEPDVASRLDAGVADVPPPTEDVQHDAGVPGVDATPLPTTLTVLGGCGIFPTDNPWNQDVSALPVHPNSAAIIAYMQTQENTALQADFGRDPSTGIPFVVVPATQAMVPIDFVEYADQSDPGPYPVPPTAPIEVGNDHHVLVLQSGTCTLFEMYHSVQTAAGWNAGSGAIFHLNSDALRPAGWTSCDQAGLPLLPGLARYDEVQTGVIHHALRFTVANPGNGFIPPATHPSGGDANAPPMGMRFRLRADFDLTPYTGNALVILQALRTYGMLVADTGSNWFISGATDSRWDDDDLNQLQNVPGSAMEVVYTGAAQETQQM